MTNRHRQCDQCKMHMPPGTPRRPQADGSLVCENCEKDPSGSRSRVSAAFERLAEQRTERKTVEFSYDTDDYPDAEHVLWAMDSAPGASVKVVGSQRHQASDYDHRRWNCQNCQHANPGWTNVCLGCGTCKDCGENVDPHGIGVSQQQLVKHDRERHQVSRKVAHDSGDGSRVFHCPFCGSGQVSGGYDGTVSCAFCGNHFTVQVQPEFAAMPQTVDGVPYPMPGMPGSQVDTQPGADAEDDVDAAAQQSGAPQSQAFPVDPNSQQLQTAQGSLPFREALAHYALKHSGTTRPLVLARVKAMHQKET